MSRRLLVVSYFHPPFPLAGGNRWLSMAHWLRRAGHEVTVLTTTAHGALESDERDGVIRAGDLAGSALLRRLARRPALERSGAGGSKPPPALLSKLIVPDAHLVAWAPWALRLLRVELRSGRYDCVVTSGPPESTHVLGLLLGRRRPAWIAEFRDGWVFEPPREPLPTAVQRALERRMEAAVVRRADGLVAATRPVAEDFGRRYGRQAVWVTNAWDPDGAPVLAPAGAFVDTDGVTLVHTGTLRGVWGRDPGVLFRALARVAAEPGPRLRLVLAGKRDPLDEQHVLAGERGGWIEHHGLVDRARAVALQRQADALVLISSPNVGEATGKLYEYIAAGRPILALADGNEAARIVRDTGTGVAVAPDDEEAIAEALRSARAGALPYAPQDTQRFTYPGPAQAMADVVEQAIARRA